MTIRILLLGDYFAAGLGTTLPYIELIKSHFSQHGVVEILNLSASAKMITESSKKIDDLVVFDPDLVILAHGITEAVIRQSGGALAWMPPRWRRPGWMDPRPYFSQRPVKRFVQRLESALRWRVKVLLVRHFARTRWMSPVQYGKGLCHLVDAIHSHTKAFVVLVSHPGIDDRYFPGSGVTLDRFWSVALNVAKAAERPDRLETLDVRQSCDRWSDFFADHFHPNLRGHEKIARSVLVHLSNSPLAPLLNMTPPLGAV